MDDVNSRLRRSETQSAPTPPFFLASLLEETDPHSTVDDTFITPNLPALLSDSLPLEFRFHRRMRRSSVRPEPTAEASTQTEGDNSQSISITRRLSKKYKQRMADFRENISHSAASSFGSRIRRASSATDVAVVSPTSPKRAARQVDERSKKQRPNMFADRNDTPAPILGAVPKTRLQYINPMFAGGEGARQAAARYNACGGIDNDFTFSQENIDARRARVASLSSAADSGADLTLAHGASSVDDDGDYAMRDADSDNFPDVEECPKTYDPLQYLPDEICLQIFEQLDASVLSAAMRVHPKWHDLANQMSVWRNAFTKKWGRTIHTNPAPILVGGPGVGIPNQPNQPWKDMYRARKELDANWRKGAAQAGKATYLSGHTDSVYCVQFDEEKIITGSRDRTIRVWDINTMQCIHVIGGPLAKPTPGPKPLRTVDYPSFHSAVASVNGSVYGQSIYKTPSQWHDASILCLQYDDKILVTGSSDSDLLVWDIKTYEPIQRLKRHTGGVLDVALDAKHIISCSKDSRIVVWDRETYEVKGVLSGHRGPVNAVQLRGKLLVSASGDGIARLWDIEQMKLLKEFSAKERGLAAVEFSEDMQHVLAGGNDHITYKFEVETGREVAQFIGHTQLVRSLWLDSANNRVVSGSYDLDLRVYDFVTGEELWHADEWTTSWMLAAKSDYRRIVATSQDGRILVIDFGLYKGGKNDGIPIKNVEKLRALPLEKTNAIIFRNPWAGPNESPVIYAR
ncbi:hypothetical protein AMS68_001015 [Peltaster fructicola]|uniref:F-box domain-containing protein n=1 Tax=Peltaster fructicola TaxID=286661 RepID=A0A6H0XLJ3_9PEZI|nr:hypothetical protein AMS68_001015 [Peltaster fructicola]